MKEKANKKELNELIERVKKPEDYKKIKKLAMHSKIKLGELRKKFCKYCFHQLSGKTRIKKGVKSVKCKNCGKVSRWKLKKVNGIK